MCAVRQCESTEKKQPWWTRSYASKTKRRKRKHDQAMTPCCLLQFIHLLLRFTLHNIQMPPAIMTPFFPLSSPRKSRPVDRAPRPGPSPAPHPGPWPATNTQIDDTRTHKNGLLSQRCMGTTDRTHIPHAADAPPKALAWPTGAGAPFQWRGARRRCYGPDFSGFGVVVRCDTIKDGGQRRTRRISTHAGVSAHHVVEEGLGPDVHMHQLPVAFPRLPHVGLGARDADLAQRLDGAPVRVIEDR